MTSDSGSTLCPFHQAVFSKNEVDLTPLLQNTVFTRKPLSQEWYGLQLQNIQSKERKFCKDQQFLHSSLIESEMHRLFFEKVDLVRSTLENYKLLDSVFEECLMQHCNLYEVSFQNLDILRCAIESSEIKSRVDFVNLDFKNCSFSGNRLDLAFVNCSFEECLFQDNELERLVFENCDLVACEFQSNSGHLQLVRCKLEETSVPVNTEELEVLEIATV